MQLTAITGMLHQPKARFTQALIEVLSAKTDRLALIDNSDVPLAIDGVTRQRLTGGCVCCSLSSALISRLGRLDADYALLPVSALADPGALAFILDSLRSELIQITTVSLIDTLTQVRKPHLTQKLKFYSDFQVYEPFDFLETVDAVVRARHMLSTAALPG
ncbi:MAG: hypothetical protein OXG60_06765 [Chloroflexi bacterium]|nr:hypothetical protein [Chloroflexota bacterium]